MPDIPKQKQDYMYDMLAGAKSGTVPYWYREKFGVATEVVFASAQTLLLINDTLGVMRVVYAGLDLLAKPGTQKLRDEVGQHVKNSAGALSLLAGDRHPLHSIVIVNLNTALESGIEDTIIVALRFMPHLIQKLGSLGINCAVSPDEGRDLSNDEARALYSQLEKWKQAQLKKRPKEQRKPPTGWLVMLDAIGIHVDLSEADCGALREMIYIRNCLIHRAGRADDDAATEMLDPPAPNTLIQIRREDMGRYVNAALNLASGISKALVKDLMLKTKT